MNAKAWNTLLVASTPLLVTTAAWTAREVMFN
jgi:hypothetical protein